MSKFKQNPDGTIECHGKNLTREELTETLGHMGKIEKPCQRVQRSLRKYQKGLEKLGEDTN